MIKGDTVQATEGRCAGQHGILKRIERHGWRKIYWVEFALGEQTACRESGLIPYQVHAGEQHKSDET